MDTDLYCLSSGIVIFLALNQHDVSFCVPKPGFLSRKNSYKDTEMSVVLSEF